MKNKRLLLYGLFIVFAVPESAFAYLDAGTGSMILQILLGGLAGLAVILKLFWRKILGVFGIRKAEEEKISSKE